MMKKIKATLFLAFFLAITTNSYALDNYPFSAGIGLMGKSGINVSDVPEGIQNAFSIHKGIDIGAMLYLPMSEEARTGVFIELAYANVPFGLKLYGENIKSYTTQKWLNISPTILMSGFLFGIDFGFDIAKDKIDDKAMFTYLPMSKNGFNVNLKAGGMFPLYASSFGVLNFTLMGTYNLTGAEYGDWTYNPVTFGIGLNYLVDLTSF